ncbi:MAG: DUF1177 domain-containing protein [Anaerolineaceae bacterium]|nr:DUF1177 domain-containing protein [Anaerolineaceae bacterium]
MSFQRTLLAYELLDNPAADGETVSESIRELGVGRVEVKRVEGDKGETDFIKILIPGSRGKTRAGKAPTLGILGQLGGVGARPEQIGLVSDGDGAVAAVASALKLARMASLGDILPGDVIITTHICPDAPVRPHDPVPFMNSPVDMATMNRHLLDTGMDAVLSIDTTKGNRILCQRGFAITPTVKEGYILRVSEDLLDIMSITTGRSPVVLAITTQDITPYGNGIFHLNSILQPATATSAACVGVAITTETIVPGCSSGATHLVDIDSVVRFVIEVAKAFGNWKCSFYDKEEYQRLVQIYGSLKHLQTLGES